jgi:hypothetical protein
MYQLFLSKKHHFVGTSLQTFVMHTLWFVRDTEYPIMMASPTGTLTALLTGSQIVSKPWAVLKCVHYSIWTLYKTNKIVL